MASGPAALVVPAVGKHTATVIMAHGLGDTGQGWISLAHNFRRRALFPHVTFIFPTAPTIPITANGAFPMPAWYDITSFTSLHLAQKTTDTPRILASRSQLHALIADERRKGIPASRIVLGGFSQGGAMALLAGLTAPEKLGGVFCLSGYLVLKDGFVGLLEEAQGAQAVQDVQDGKGPEVFMGHGGADPLVKCEWGRLTAETLRGWGWRVRWRVYEGLEHSVDPGEMDDVEGFLGEKIPEKEA